LLATPLAALEPFASPHAGEMIRLVELHLRSHFTKFAGFRSLALLLSLEGQAA
jgi:hypothetical protein